MKTFAKTGRDALSHLFAKREIFSSSRYEDLEMVKTYPRVVTVSKKPINLEQEYLAHMVGVLDREKNYKIFLWNVESGLKEVQLESDENEGKLINLITDSEYLDPTHIVIAEKEEWTDSSSFPWDVKLKLAENDVEAGQPCSVERVNIYSLNEEQKREISEKMQ